VIHSAEYYAKLFGVKKEHTTAVSTRNAEIEANRPNPTPRVSMASQIRRRFYALYNGATLIKHGWIDGRELSLIRWNKELRNSQAKRVLS
jgi:hypothetical protein